MAGRLSKIIMCLAFGVFAGLVAVDNIIDYGTNYAFVEHVLAMDTIFPGSLLRSRAITSATLWRVAYGIIISGEAATGLLFLVAAGALWRARCSAGRFQAAKRWVHAAAGVGFLVWFLGFEAVGGEWFAMWQSPRWNGQEAAFRIIVTMLAVLIYVNQPEGRTDDAPEK